MKGKLKIKKGGQWLLSPTAQHTILSRETFTDEHRQIEKMVFDFAEDTIFPQVKDIEEQQTKQSIARQEMAKHDNRSSSDIDNDRNAMIATLEASITEEPEQLEKMKTIINDWADMKIKSFKNRRSWVRNPEDENA